MRRMIPVFSVTALLAAQSVWAAENGCGWSLRRWQTEQSYESRSGGLLSTSASNQTDPCDAVPHVPIVPLQANLIKHSADRLTIEIAAADGEYLRSLASLYNIPKHHFNAFALLLREHYDSIFPTADATLQTSYHAIAVLIKQHPELMQHD